MKLNHATPRRAVKRPCRHGMTPGGGETSTSDNPVAFSCWTRTTHHRRPMPRRLTRDPNTVAFSVVVRHFTDDRSVTPGREPVNDPNCSRATDDPPSLPHTPRNMPIPAAHPSFHIFSRPY